jgi:hypothetical protein
LGNIRKSTSKRTTVGVKASTKAKLDQNRAPGQCYDGFINQLLDLWETTKIEAAKKSKG